MRRGPARVHGRWDADGASLLLSTTPIVVPGDGAQAGLCPTPQSQMEQVYFDGTARNCGELWRRFLACTAGRCEGPRAACRVCSSQFMTSRCISPPDLARSEGSHAAASQRGESVGAEVGRGGRARLAVHVRAFANEGESLGLQRMLGTAQRAPRGRSQSVLLRCVSRGPILRGASTSRKKRTRRRRRRAGNGPSISRKWRRWVGAGRRVHWRWLGRVVCSDRSCPLPPLQKASARREAAQEGKDAAAPAPAGPSAPLA